jgi:hypothetical protein
MAIETLRVYPPFEEPAPGEEFNQIWTWEVSPISVSWFIEQMLPAIVLLVLAAAGTYLSITERNKVATAIKKPAVTKTSKAASSKAASSKASSSKPKKPASKAKAKPKPKTKTPAKKLKR